jgi:hypothetical protein
MNPISPYIMNEYRNGRGGVVKECLTNVNGIVKQALRLLLFFIRRQPEDRQERLRCCPEHVCFL